MTRHSTMRGEHTPHVDAQPRVGRELRSWTQASFCSVKKIPLGFRAAFDTRHNQERHNTDGKVAQRAKATSLIILVCGVQGELRMPCSSGQ